MSLQELREQALQLSVSDRLALMKTILYSLEEELRPRLVQWHQDLTPLSPAMHKIFRVLLCQFCQLVNY